MHHVGRSSCHTHIISEGNVEMWLKFGGNVVLFWYSKSNWNQFLNYGLFFNIHQWTSGTYSLCQCHDPACCACWPTWGVHCCCKVYNKPGKQVCLVLLPLTPDFAAVSTQWWYLAVAWAEVRPKPYTFCQNQGLFADTMCSQNKGTITYPFFSEALCNDSEQNG